MTHRTTRLIETTLGQIKDGWKASINRYTGETELKPTKLSSGRLSQMLIELHGEDLRYNELALVAELGFSRQSEITGADADHLYVHLGAHRGGPYPNAMQSMDCLMLQCGIRTTRSKNSLKS